VTGKTLSSQQIHAQTLATSVGVQLPSAADPAFLPPGPPQTITGAYDNTVTLSGNYLNLTVTSTGSINPGIGGSSYNNGVSASYYAPGVYVLNQGSITGGAGGSNSYSNGYGGGTGVNLLAADTINNAGTVSGGAGGGSSLYRGGNGGYGVALDVDSGASMVTNSGTITGGTGGYGGQYGGRGGTGMFAYGTLSMVNSGLIAGGQGGSASANGYTPGVGGRGLVLEGNFQAAQSGSPNALATNAGTILGGNAGPAAKYGASGGVGVVLQFAGLTNTGLIEGGAGGIGVYMYGSTLTNAGTISGGAGYNGNPAYDAIKLFGFTNNTLVVDPGAVFNGQVAVVESFGYTEALDLGGTTAGTLTGLGTQFTGFNSLTADAGSDWTLSGGNTLAGGTSLAVDGKLAVNGTLDDPGAASVAAGGELRAGGNGVVLLSALSIGGGIVAMGADAQIVVGGSAAYTSRGALTVASGYSVYGYGTIDGVAGATQVVDNGSIIASGGTLDIARAISGTGVLAIDSGAAVVASGAVTVADVTFDGAGTLTLADPTSFTSTISGFSTGDTIDLEHLNVKSVRFSHHTLTLFGPGHHTLGTLLFTGHYKHADFALSSAAGGTDLNFTTPSAADFVPPLGAEASTPAASVPLETGWHAQDPLGHMPDLLTLHHFGN
jgi:hypothetical protein